MQPGKDGGNAAVGKHLADVALSAFVEFLIQGGFSFGKRAGEGAGRDEESQQEHCPAPAAQAKNDRPFQQSPPCPRPAQAAGAIGGKGDDGSAEETKNKLKNGLKHIFHHEAEGIRPVYAGVMTINSTASRNNREETTPLAQRIYAIGRRSSRR